MDKGMLSTRATGRPSFIRYLTGLYRGDAMFRGVVDFTVIGGIVILFLHFYPTKDGKPSEQRATSQTDTTASKSTPPTPNTTTSNSTSSGAGRTADKAETPKPLSAPTLLAIQFPKSVTQPTLGFTRNFDVDPATFRNSTPADQPRLFSALRAAHAQQFAEISKILIDASASDPNVAFLRGVASITAGTPEGNKEAERLWQSAADAGHREAALELARIMIYAPPGITKNVDQGRHVIEAAAATGDRRAQRMAAIAYLSGQFGINPTKARDSLRQAAQAGDTEAMMYYSFILGWAIGGVADQAGAEDFLRRAATGGLTLAQETLGSFLLSQYKQKIIDDPLEGLEWLEKASKGGFSLVALRTLAVFRGAQTQPAEKAKAFELAKLCSGIKDPWCQAENGWVFQFGVGTKRDLVKAFAYYQVALEIGYAATPKSLEAINGQISAGDKVLAVELSQKISSALKPVPPLWDMQYVGVVPPSRWTVSELEAVPAPMTCTRVEFRQITDLCNNCTAPPWTGSISKSSGDEWTTTFIDGHNKSGSTKWRQTSQANSEIMMQDNSRNLYMRFDLAARKGYQRRGTTDGWTNTLEILNTDCH